MHPAKVAIINPPFGDIIRAHHCSYITSVMRAHLLSFLRIDDDPKPAHLHCKRFTLVSPSESRKFPVRDKARLGLHVYLITRQRELSIHGLTAD